MSLILEHVRECFPEQWARLGRTGMRRLVQRAVSKAREHGFEELADIQQYVDLVVVLGEDFELKEEFSWAREILRDTNPAGAKFRATWLYDNVKQYLAEKESGKRN